MSPDKKKHWNTIIIGGGQAGLATGYYLKQAGEDFLILEGAETIGDSWRRRWDSLRLFTPGWANNMPGLRFPAPQKEHATKDQVADYLNEYVTCHQLPVLTGTRVTKLTYIGKGYYITTTKGTFICHNVVIANGGYAAPKIPSFARSIHPRIRQWHSSEYKRPSQLPDGNILVVGAGTSGIQIAIDLADGKKNIFLSGTPPKRIPDFILDRLGKPFVWAMNHIMTIKTLPGRKAAHGIRTHKAAAPLIHTSLEDAIAKGVVPVPKLAGVFDGVPVLNDGTHMTVDAIVWCTGYHIDLSWVDIEGFTDADDQPYAYRGISKTHQGLYFVGMPFQYALTSTWINGVGRDARFVASHINKFMPRQKSFFLYSTK